MPKAIKFLDTFYANGAPLYEMGKIYVAIEETTRQAFWGHAQEVTVKASEIIPLGDTNGADQGIANAAVDDSADLGSGASTAQSEVPAQG